MPRRILVVDDDRAVRQMLTRLLQDEGYEAAQARDALEARNFIAVREFQLLIFDVVMPGESGLELAQSFRGRGCETPIILVSGYPADGPVEFANSHRRVTFVPKPFSADDFLAHVEGMLAPAAE